MHLNLFMLVILLPLLKTASQWEISASLLSSPMGLDEKVLNVAIAVEYRTGICGPILPSSQVDMDNAGQSRNFDAACVPPTDVMFPETLADQSCPVLTHQERTKVTLYKRARYY